MKKRLIILSVFFILSSFALPAVAAPLESLAPQGGASGARATGIVQGTTNSGGSQEQAAASLERAVNIEQAGIDDAMPPVGDKIARFGSEAIGGIVHIITWWLLKVATFILFLIGGFFNFIVEQLVVNMGHFVTSSDAVGIQIAWRIMRDLANLAIIGGLIATAIGTILHLAAINAQKLLVRLIIAALLVNFSFFFAGAIIDSSNFLATSIYKATISTKSCGESCNIVDRFDRVIQTNNHNIIEYLKQKEVEGIPQDSQWMAVLQDILSIVLIAVTIFVFLSAASLLLGRFVALILILITSPIGIAGMTIPQMNKYAKEWWEALFSQAFFAPVYFLLVGFSLTILDNSSGAFSGDSPNLIGTLLTFMVATVFMLQSLKIAKGMSEASKRLADVYKASDKLAGWMPKAYTTMLSTAAVESVGRGSEFLLDKYNNWKSSGTKGLIGKSLSAILPDKYIKKGLEGVAKAKFGGDEGYVDARGRRKGRNAELDLTKQRQTAEAELRKSLEPANKAREKHLLDLQNGLDPEKNAQAKENYKDYIKKTADVERALTNFREASAYYKTRNPKYFEKLAPFLSSGDFAEIIGDKEVPKNIRDKMREDRFSNVLNILAQAEKLQKEPETGARTAKLKTLRAGLFNLFKRGGFSMSDFDALLQFKPDLDHNVFFLEGITSGARSKTQETSVFGKAQQRLAKTSWRVQLSDWVKQTGSVEEVSDATKEEIAAMAKEKNLGPEETAAALEQRRVNPGNTWNDTIIHNGNFTKAVSEWKEYIAGKQPHELPAQISDSMVMAPVFAAAITPEKLAGLVGKKDDNYLNTLTDNLVALSLDKEWGDPDMRAQVQGVIEWIEKNPEGQTLYGGRLRASRAKLGEDGNKDVAFRKKTPPSGGGTPKPRGGGSPSGGGQNTPSAPSSPNIPSGEEPVGEQDASPVVRNESPGVTQASNLYSSEGGGQSGGSSDSYNLTYTPTAEPVADFLTPTDTPAVATTAFNDFAEQFDPADTSERSIQMARTYYQQATDEQILSIPARDIIKPAVLASLKGSTLQKVVQRWRNDPELLKKMYGVLVQLNNRVSGLPEGSAKFIASDEFKNLTTPKE